MGLIRYELGRAFPGVIRRTTERLSRARRRLGCCGLRQVRMIVLALLGAANFDVDLEFSGGAAEARMVDVAAHVPVDGGEGVA